MTIKPTNKRVIITMPKEKYKAFKKMAVDQEKELSEVLVDAGTITYEQWLKSKNK